MIRPLAFLGNQNQAQPAWRYQGYELVIDIDPAVTCEDVSFPIAVIAFRRSSSNTPSGCPCASP
jgi:hypothetical protein